MLVKSDETTQGCNRIYPYRGMTLSNNMTATSTFDASFRCSSRTASSGVVDPYLLSVGSARIALPYESNISNLFNGLGI